jgi:hypothetical protein
MRTDTLVLDVLSYSDWEDGEATPHNCNIFQEN